MRSSALVILVLLCCKRFHCVIELSSGVGDAVVQASRRAGLTKHTTPHSMRHAYAVHLLEAGTDIRKIQLLLGHRSLSTTARYLRLATTTVCATTSPLDLLPLPIADPKP